MYQTVFKCVTSKKGLNHFFECMTFETEYCQFIYLLEIAGKRKKNSSMPHCGNRDNEASHKFHFTLMMLLFHH